MKKRNILLLSSLLLMSLSSSLVVAADGINLMNPQQQARTIDSVVISPESNLNNMRPSNNLVLDTRLRLDTTSTGKTFDFKSTDTQLSDSTNSFLVSKVKPSKEELESLVKSFSPYSKTMRVEVKGDSEDTQYLDIRLDNSVYKSGISLTQLFNSSDILELNPDKHGFDFSAQKLQSAIDSTATAKELVLIPHAGNLGHIELLVNSKYVVCIGYYSEQYPVAGYEVRTKEPQLTDEKPITIEDLQENPNVAQDRNLNKYKQDIDEYVESKYPEDKRATAKAFMYNLASYGINIRTYFTFDKLMLEGKIGTQAINDLNGMMAEKKDKLKIDTYISKKIENVRAKEQEIENKNNPVVITQPVTSNDGSFWGDLGGSSVGTVYNGSVTYNYTPSNPTVSSSTVTSTNDKYNNGEYYLGSKDKNTGEALTPEDYQTQTEEEMKDGESSDLHKDQTSWGMLGDASNLYKVDTRGTGLLANVYRGWQLNVNDLQGGTWKYKEERPASIDLSRSTIPLSAITVEIPDPTMIIVLALTALAFTSATIILIEYVVSGKETEMKIERSIALATQARQTA